MTNVADILLALKKLSDEDLLVFSETAKNCVVQSMKRKCEIDGNHLPIEAAAIIPVTQTFPVIYISPEDLEKAQQKEVEDQQKQIEDQQKQIEAQQKQIEAQQKQIDLQKSDFDDLKKAYDFLKDDLQVVQEQKIYNLQQSNERMCVELQKLKDELAAEKSKNADLEVKIAAPKKSWFMM